MFMVFEFLDHDLTGLLESKLQLSDALVKYYLKSILEGLAYLHAKGIMHRDIKGANILVSNEGDVRIADMGLARSVAKGGYTNRVVTLWYRAPEVGDTPPHANKPVEWLDCCFKLCFCSLRSALSLLSVTAAARFE